MNHPASQAALDTVMTMPPGSPPAMLAIDVCELRGINPYGFPPIAGPVIMNWQRVIVEAYQMALLARVLA